MSLPPLPTDSQKSESILIGSNNANLPQESDEALLANGGKWEDEEERKFFEDIQDLKDFVPKSVLGIEGDEMDKKEKELEREKLEQEKAAEEAKKLEEELADLKIHVENGVYEETNGIIEKAEKDSPREDEDG